MKHPLPIALLVAALLITTCWLNLSAQSNSKVDTVTEEGVTKSVFETPSGKLNVYVPDDMSDGDTISGTVIAEPAGNTEEERKQNEDVLTGYVVDIKPKQATEEKHCKLSQPDFTCLIPPLCPAITITIADTHQKTCSNEVTCLAKPPALICKPDQAILPTQGTCGKPLKVKGKCDGKFDNSAILIGKKKCRMLAESPRQQSCLSPIDIVGVVQIESIEGPRHTIGTFRNEPPASQPRHTTHESKPALDLTDPWAFTGTAEGHTSTMPASVTQQGSSVDWQLADTHYTGNLSGNTIQFTMDGTYWTGSGALTVSPDGTRLSGSVNYQYKSGRASPNTMTIEMQR